MSSKSLGLTVSILDFHFDKEFNAMKFRIFVSIMFVVSIFGQTNPVLAATYNVPCNTKSLIRAIAVANATSTNDTINLKARCTYRLRVVDNQTLGATGLPIIADVAIAGKLTINGKGATIERSKVRNTLNFRILAVAIGGDLTIKNVTLRNGNLPTDNGGAISSNGTLTVINSTITGNNGLYGGGIAFDSSGALTVTNSRITGNTSVLDGGGINSAGILIVTSSTFSGNTAQGLGGGILVAQGTATVTNSTFSGNAANGLAGGGGILNGGCGCGPSELTVSGSTFTNNIANGGALFNTAIGTMTVTNSTISGNQGIYRVGGIFNAGTLTVTHTTITGNISEHEGGGVFNDGGIINLGSTIVAANTATSGPDVFGSITSLGYNIISNTSDAIIIGDTSGNLTDASAVPLNLGSLQDNGGPTQTISLGAGSVAINAGDPGFAPPPDFDQRGNSFPRIVGGRIDIGAYESNP